MGKGKGNLLMKRSLKTAEPQRQEVKPSILCGTWQLGGGTCRVVSFCFVYYGRGTAEQTWNQHQLFTSSII
jgi:hypothetical protein